MCALLAIKLMVRSINILGSVSLLIGQDETHHLRRHVIISRHDDADMLHAVLLLESKNLLWLQKFIIRKRVDWMQWCQLINRAQYKKWHLMRSRRMSNHQSARLANYTTISHHTMR